MTVDGTGPVTCPSVRTSSSDRTGRAAAGYAAAPTRRRLPVELSQPFKLPNTAFGKHRALCHGTRQDQVAVMSARRALVKSSADWYPEAATTCHRADTGMSTERDSRSTLVWN